MDETSEMRREALNWAALAVENNTKEYLISREIKVGGVLLGD